MMVLLAGCFSPTSTADKRLKEVDKAKAKEAENHDRQNAKASAFVHGTGLALGKVEGTNQAVRIAKTLNHRAAVITGPPSYEDAVKMDELVEDGTSEDAKRVAAAEKRLAEMDGEVARLQGALVALEKKTEKAETKRDETLMEFAGELGTWRGIKRLIFFGGLTLVLFIVGPIVLGVIGTMFPMAAPVTGIVSKMMGGMARSVTRVVPSVAKDAGLVAAKEYERARAAAEDMSVAIARLKANNRDAFQQTVAPALRDAQLARSGTDLDTNTILAELKAEAAKRVA